MAKKTSRKRPPSAKSTRRPKAAPAVASVAKSEPNGDSPRTLWERLYVGRERGHRLEIRLANCSITQIEARSYVLGLYREVAPSGAASAVDDALDGAISELTDRRMFSGNVGEVFVLPASRRQLPTDSVLFVGLGFFDQFKANAESVLEIAAENTLRLFARARIEDFATVLLGVTSDRPTHVLVEHLIAGLVRGKRDADRDQNFRRVTICETDDHRYEEIRQAVFHLASTPLCDDVAVSISDVPPRELRPLPRAREAVTAVLEGGIAPSGLAQPSPDPVYLIVRQEPTQGGGPISFQSSVLTAGGKAAVLSGCQTVKPADLEALYQSVDAIKPSNGRRASLAQLSQIGARVGGTILGKDISTVLRTHKDRHLVVVQDSETSRVPWELLSLNGWVPAVECGLSRRYMADNLSIAKYLEQRLSRPRIRLLLIVNPTGDLKGAEHEGGRIESLINKNSGFRIKQLRGSNATHAALKNAFESGDFDIVHYAGHAFFDPLRRSRSGLICADRQVFSGADLSNLPALPGLVVFNACESGRVRGYFDPRKKTPTQELISMREVNVGLAEAFLRGGVANYIGTYWPVDDSPAETFASEFYDALLKGRSLGQALVNTRSKLLNNMKEIDWADYIHYGDQNFVLRNPLT